MVKDNTGSEVETLLLISYLRSVRNAIKFIASKEILNFQYSAESSEYTDDSPAKIDRAIEECLIELKVQINIMVEYHNRRSDTQLDKNRASLANITNLDAIDRQMYHIAYYGRTETDISPCGDLFYPNDIAAMSLWQIDEQSRLNN